MPFVQPSDADHLAPWIIDVFAYTPPHAQSNWNIIAPISGTGVTTYPFNAYRWNNGVQFAFLNYFIPIAAGSWSYYYVGVLSASYGIMTLSIGGIDVGTIDLYSASDVYGQFGPINFTLSAGSLRTLKMRVDTKNASSGGYHSAWNAFRLLRTA